MGCDGGTIPRRDELVRTKKKPEQKDKNAETVAKWKHCAISQDPLRKPIVACELGRLYNKESVIEHILNKDKATSSQNASHITKMSDVKELKLTEKPDFQQKEHKGDEYIDLNNSRFICPVTGLDMNGRQRFYLFWKCGCVVSERAIKEVKSETCHKCGKSYDANDVIVLNGTDEEMESLKDKMTERRRLAKLEKKKKRSAAVATDSSIEKKIKIEPEAKGSPTLSNGVSSFKPVNGITTGIANGKLLSNYDKPSCSSSSAKVDKSKDTAAGTSKMIKLPEKALNTYSIAKDPTASSAYKSLFTTCQTAKQQVKAHWVTHNPCFY